MYNWYRKNAEGGCSGAARLTPLSSASLKPLVTATPTQNHPPPICFPEHTHVGATCTCYAASWLTLRSLPLLTPLKGGRSVFVFTFVSPAEHHALNAVSTSQIPSKYLKHEANGWKTAVPLLESHGDTTSADLPFKATSYSKWCWTELW